MPSANRISLLRDGDGNGVAETKTAFMQGLNSPFGMALVGEDLYVANTDAVVKVPYTEGTTTLSAAPVKVLDLPAGPRNHHWTKNIIASPDGRRLYIAIGSNSNVGENGLDEEQGRAEVVGTGSADRRSPNVCQRPAQSGRDGLGAAHRQVVGGGERA